MKVEARMLRPLLYRDLCKTYNAIEFLSRLELHACHFAPAQLQFLTHTLVARLSCAVVSFLDEKTINGGDADEKHDLNFEHKLVGM